MSLGGRGVIKKQINDSIDSNVCKERAEGDADKVMSKFSEGMKNMGLKANGGLEKGRLHLKAAFAGQGRKRRIKAAIPEEGRKRRIKAAFSKEGRKRRIKAAIPEEGWKRRIKAAFSKEGWKRRIKAACSREFWEASFRDALAKEKRGRLLLIVVLLAQCLLFYWLMQIEIYYLALSLFTFLFLYLFFFGFQNKWIPFGINVVFTILMFADVTFNNYFNGYLSLDMMGSAQYVGDVLDTIGKVIRPQFLLLFLWIPLAVMGIRRQNRQDAASAAEESRPSEVLLSPAEGSLAAGGTAGQTGQTGQTGTALRSRPCKKQIILAVLLFFLAVNPLGMTVLKSIGNLEFFSFHAKDIVRVSTGFGEDRHAVAASMNYHIKEGDPLFGLAKGKNLIVIQVEALQNFVLDAHYNGKEITPVLNRLAKDSSLYFDHYYMQIGAGNTSDAEFATNNSLYGTPKSYTYEIYKDNAFRGLPWLLMEKGYSTIAMHGYRGDFWSRDVMYPSQGFQAFVDADGFLDRGLPTAWGINDEEFFKQAVQYLKLEKQPFYSLLVTLSSHTPFELPPEFEKLGNIRIKKEHRGTRFGNYLSAISYTDHALGVFLEKLKEAGLYENSVIAIYGDHFGLSISDDRNEELMEEFLGKPYRFDTMANIPLIIHMPAAAPGLLPRVISAAGGQLDFLPTIAYLMGFEKLDTLYIGNNLLTEKSGFVIQDRYAPPGSFLTNTMAYLGAGDGVFETGRAWNINSYRNLRKDSGMEKLSLRARGLLNLSAEYLEKDEIRKLYYGNGKAAKTQMRRPKSGAMKEESSPAQIAPPKKAEPLKPEKLPKKEEEQERNTGPMQEDGQAAEGQPGPEENPATGSQPNREEGLAVDSQPSQEESPATDSQPNQEEGLGTDNPPSQEEGPAVNGGPNQGDGADS